MNISIKNINEENWRTIKSEAAKRETALHTQVDQLQQAADKNKSLAQEKEKKFSIQAASLKEALSKVQAAAMTKTKLEAKVLTVCQCFSIFCE